MPQEFRRSSDSKKKGRSQEEESGSAEPEQGANEGPERDNGTKTPPSRIASPPRDTPRVPNGDERPLPAGPVPPAERRRGRGREFTLTVEEWETPVGRQLEALRRLAQAMLRQAAVDLWFARAERVKTDGVSRELYLVKQYVLATDYDWVLSFCNCCDLVGVDPPYLRRRILEGPGIEVNANLAPAKAADALDAAFKELMEKVLDDDGSDDDEPDHDESSDDESNEGGAAAAEGLDAFEEDDEDDDEEDSPAEG